MNWMKWILFGDLITEENYAGCCYSSNVVPAAVRWTRRVRRDGYLEYTDHGLRQYVDLKEGETSVGSSRCADCVIGSQKVSPKHIVIVRKGSKYSIQNLSSKGSTYVGNRLLPKNAVQTIEFGTVIFLSGFKMTFQRWSA